MPKLKKIPDQCHSFEEIRSESKDESSDVGRILRKRKVNLNRLASSVSCPEVCQFQHCGVQLANDDTLEWHYEGHYAQEVERLGHIRVKKNPSDFPDRQKRRQVRDIAFERITRRRTLRQVLRNGTRTTTTAQSALENEDLPDLTCPVCNLPVPSNDYTQHIEHCLINADPVSRDFSDQEDEEVDMTEGVVETYTWAGHTRVRATSLVEGGLRGPGFVEITNSSEDQILDIEGYNDDEASQEFNSDGSPSQYTESDLILPQPETEAEAEELESRANIQEALTGNKNSTKILPSNGNCETSSSSTSLALSGSDKKNIVEQLREENDQLRQKSMCNICMDSYQTPLVSTVCWHVSCEECWMRALGAKKLCPQCKVIIQPKHLRKIYL